MAPALDLTLPFAAVTSLLLCASFWGARLVGVVLIDAAAADDLVRLVSIEFDTVEIRRCKMVVKSDGFVLAA